MFRASLHVHVQTYFETYATILLRTRLGAIALAWAPGYGTKIPFVYRLHTLCLASCRGDPVDPDRPTRTIGRVSDDPLYVTEPGEQELIPIDVPPTTPRCSGRARGGQGLFLCSGALGVLVFLLYQLTAPINHLTQKAGLGRVPPSRNPFPSGFIGV